MEVRRFRFSYYANGIVLQETDIDETYMLNHGPYKDAQEAWDAMICILETGYPPGLKLQAG